MLIKQKIKVKYSEKIRNRRNVEIFFKLFKHEVNSKSNLEKIKPQIKHEKHNLMPCPSMGPKLFWTVQIILVKYQYAYFWNY